MRPPPLTRRLLAWLAPADLREPLVDDLDEAWRARAETRGPARARWWYRRQIVTGLWALLVLRARARRGQAKGTGKGDRQTGRMGGVDMMWHDVQYAVRAIRRTPGFAAVAMLSLALGIGANTAVFSVVHAVLLRPLPYPQPDRLFVITPPGPIGAVNLPQFDFVKRHATSFASVGGRNGWSDASLSAGGETLWIKAMPVSADFFKTLGAPPVLGHEFADADTTPGGPRLVILSDGLWRRAFHADPAVIGGTAMLGDSGYTVVGVLPASLWLPEPADAFYPLRPTGREIDKGWNTEMIARLAPGVSRGQADAEMASLSAVYLHQAGEDDFKGLILQSVQEMLVGKVRTNLLLLFGAVGTLLVIACSNLASLLLARAAAREREIAVRLALGASASRLMRQFVVESLILAFGGTAAGLAAAYWTLDGFLALMPVRVPLAEPIRLDLPAFGFAVAAGLATGLIFSVAPLLTSLRGDTPDTLRAGSRAVAGTRRSQRARSILIVAEVALSVSLLVAAALLGQSLYRLHQEPLGFSPGGALTFWTPSQGERRREGSGRWQFESTVAERLRAIPGVTAVAGTNLLPLTSQMNFPTERVGHPDEAIGGMEIRFVTPEYFEVLGIPITQGRRFTSRDTSGAAPVILVNETVARRWWKGGSPLGDQIEIGRFRGKLIGATGEGPRQVVGVVANTKSVVLKAAPRPTVYIPSAQAPWMTAGTTWVVRGDLSRGLGEEVRRAIGAIDPRQRIERIRTLDEIVAATTADSRFDAWLSGAFALLALALTGIGIYGLLAFSVARRTSEIGTRIALGASRGRVMLLVVRQGLALTATGLVLGLGCAWWLSRSVSALLFGVSATDPASFIAVAVVLLSVAILASGLPARRAARVDPLVALRAE